MALSPYLPLESESASGGLPKIAPLTKMKVYDQQTGRILDSTDVNAVDKIIELRDTKSVWDVIDELVQIWSERTPEEFQGLKVTIDDLRETRKDRKYGKTDDKNMDRRLTMVFPITLQAWIRKIYSVEELPFDQKFLREFAQRYKGFRVPEKL